MKKKFLIILLLLLFNIGNNPVYSKGVSNRHVIEHQKEQSVLNKYFKRQARKLKKSWMKNKNIFIDSKYKTSYARVLFTVNSNGEILSYQIKSSCIPSGDKIFIEQVNNTIKEVKKFDKFPANYNNTSASFTVKFHVNFPLNLSETGIDWARYGISDIELDNHKFVIIQK